MRSGTYGRRTADPAQLAPGRGLPGGWQGRRSAGPRRGVDLCEETPLTQHSRLILGLLLAVIVSACQASPEPVPATASMVTETVPPLPTATLPSEGALALVIEEEADPATATPLPKATFYFFSGPG